MRRMSNTSRAAAKPPNCERSAELLLTFNENQRRFEGMNPRALFPIALALALQTIGSVDSLAAGKPPAKAAAKAPAKKETSKHVPITIAAVSADSISITDPNGNKTYKIDKDTQI